MLAYSLRRLGKKKKSFLGFAIYLRTVPMGSEAAMRCPCITNNLVGLLFHCNSILVVDVIAPTF
jgi:hypothetical protein